MERETRHRLLGLVCAGILAVAGVMATSPRAKALRRATGTLVKRNCAPVAAAADGTMVWWSRNAAGVDDAYIGNGDCHGKPLLPPYDGNRGPSDMTRNGRYVLLTTAVGWDRTTEFAAPGKGSGNAIQVFDRRRHRLSTLLPGALSTQPGVIWPTFNASATKIAWAQMVLGPLQANFPWGDWELHVADVNLARGTLSHNRAWRDPVGGYAMIEAYGWIPRTHRIIFQSTAESTTTDPLRSAQLWTLPDTFTSTTRPTRISPMTQPASPGQQPQDVFHEFAHFAPHHPYTLYTSIGSDTLGGNDLFAYDLRTEARDGLLAQPRRISYFGGDPAHGYVSRAVPGWPAPSPLRVVTGMAWVHGAWIAGVCGGLLDYCRSTDAYRITLPGSRRPARPT